MSFLTHLSGEIKWMVCEPSLPPSKTEKNDQVDRKYKDFTDDDDDCAIQGDWDSVR